MLMMKSCKVKRRLSDTYSICENTPDIIKLQLRKPKNWNWELSTSKSSPHISLPTIQLYDYKGKLLVEANDNGMQRRTWHSTNDDNKEISRNYLGRCKSDILDLHKKQPVGKFESINRSRKYPKSTIRQQQQQQQERGDKSINCYELPEKSGTTTTTSSTTTTTTNANITENTRKKRIRRRSDSREKCDDNTNPLRKSKSDMFYVKDQQSNLIELLRKNSLKNLNGNKKSYKRTRSDDVYQRLLKYNDESLKRAITDGYSKFMIPKIRAEEERIENNKNDKKKLKKNRQYQRCDIDEITNLNNFNKIEFNQFKHNKYITRTSKAGTLIIKEDTFSSPNWRRRKSDIDNASNFIENDKENLKMLPHSKSATCVSNCNNLRAVRTNSSICNINIIEDKIIDTDINLKEDDNSEINTNNYVVQEPPSDYSRKNSETFIKPNENCVKMKNRRKLQKCFSDISVLTASISTSSSSSSITKAKDKTARKKGVSSKARVIIKENDPLHQYHHPQHHPHQQRRHRHQHNNTEETDLLKLVRKLSIEQQQQQHNVKMGANVSRHSSKGLGRRSQSSGSICNSKGRHSNDGKMCGSLPSYLEDRSNGCNNNHHDCDKRPIDEVDRIPPLGDSAPLHWKFSDTQTALCDQGYGSERSPEEEYPPPLPDHDQCHHHLDPYACYPFITPESTFTVTLAKGSRGLGLSVTGGIDSNGSWPGLIRIKRLFPHQPASSSGMLNVGDLLLEANGIPLTGLTNYEALEVLRTTPNQVDLRVCRPPPDVLSCVSPISEVPPPPPRREPPGNLSFHSHSDLEEDHYHGEFEITLTKIKGSLGFTLRKEDDSALGHYVRALVREPALTDGRIQAGDKIIAANDVEISSMSHEQAVQFLRQCGEVVKLRLYRDFAQTPVATLSPTETTPRTSFSRKTHLRQEAVDMLNDIAARKLIPASQEQFHLSMSPNISPRRLRRQPCPSDASQNAQDMNKYEEQFHEGLLQQCNHPYDDDQFNSLFIIDDDCDKPSRPSSLDLYNPNQTPVATRKPKFNFSLAHNAYELNNLDPEVLDAPNLTYNLNNDDVKSTEVECGDSFPQEPVSMPHIPSDNPGFSYKNPAYQSAHPPLGVESTTNDNAQDDKSNVKTTTAQTTVTGTNATSNIDDGNIQKRKGPVFNEEEENENKNQNQAGTTQHVEADYQILAIELNRGWNSRLGFSLQGAAGYTYVSAVHADSVAARDGRIKPGDRLIKVNDESVENMTTSEIIDLLRIVRGPVCIVVSRTKSKEDCTKSNAEN